MRLPAAETNTSLGLVSWLAMEELGFPARMSASVMLHPEIVNWEPTVVEKNLPLAPEPDPQTGYLLVGHGTRRAKGQQQFRQVFEQFAREMAPSASEMAFLELADPDITTAIQRLATRGIKNLVTVPVLLFEAGHALQDIPEQVQLACTAHDVCFLHQTGAFLSSGPILSLSALRFREAVCNQSASEWLRREEPRFCCSGCENNCSEAFCSRVALLMIGRGSNSSDATKAMLRFTDRRCKLTKVNWAKTAFIHGQSPNVDEGIKELAGRPEPIKVVQPHLIFEGLLSADLQARVERLQKHSPEQLWVMPGVLADDHKLAQTLADIAKNAK